MTRKRIGAIHDSIKAFELRRSEQKKTLVLEMQEEMLINPQGAIRRSAVKSRKQLANQECQEQSVSSMD